MKNYLPLTISTFCALIPFFNSCSTSGSSTSHDVDTLTVAKSTLELVIPYDDLQKPWKILTGKNHILVVNSSTDTLIDRFTLDGKYLDRFLRQGQGPQEVKAIEGLQYAGFNDDLYITVSQFEPMKVITNMRDSVPYPTETIKLNYSDSALVYPKGGNMVLANGTIVTQNANMAGMFAVFGPDHNFSKIMQPYPPKSEFGEGIPDYGLFNFYYAYTGVSPDGKHFVAAFNHGDMLAFGKLDADTVSLDFHMAQAPKGIVVKTADSGSFSFEFTDEWIDTYGSVTLSDKNVYILYYGDRKDYYTYWHKSPEGFTQQIRVYDFDGRHIRTILIPDFVAIDIAVTPDDRWLYILDEDNEEGFRIQRLDLSSI